MNWGWKIAIGYSIFVAGILSLVVVAYRQTDDLVSADYYAQEIQFQQRIDARGNSLSLQTPFAFEWVEDGRRLLLHFPDSLEQIQAELQLYRPSDASQDQRISLQPTSGQTEQLDLQSLSSGFWRVHLDWTSSGRAFYNETTLVIP